MREKANIDWHTSKQTLYAIQHENRVPKTTYRYQYEKWMVRVKISSLKGGCYTHRNVHQNNELEARKIKTYAFIQANEWKNQQNVSNNGEQNY